MESENGEPPTRELGFGVGNLGDFGGGGAISGRGNLSLWVACCLIFLGWIKYGGGGDIDVVLGLGAWWWECEWMAEAGGEFVG